MPKKILIIEDEESLSEMYKMKLEQGGYLVFTANQGQIGIELAKTQKPDLILLDLVMPQMDGYQVLKKLRSMKETKSLKVYILSNLSQDKEIDNGFARGADGYLVKANLTPSQLFDRVTKIFSGEKVGLKKSTVKKQIELSKAAKDQASPSMKKGKILLIEDEEVIIEMYKLRLEKEGYEVQVARNGAWGLKVACQESFDLIIMDMVMPAMNGYEMLEKIKKNKACKNIPVIVLSNSAQDNEINKAKELGATSYFLKSQITPAKLVKEVKELLN